MNLSATVLAGATGVSGKTVNFTLNGSSAGSATTDSSGVANLSNTSLAGIPTGTYPAGVGATFATDSTHSGSADTAALTVDPATLSVDAVDESKTYGDPDPAFTYTLSGFVNGENATSAGVTGSADCSRSNPAVDDAGTYPDVISCDPDSLAAANYLFVTGGSADFAINAANQTIDFTQPTTPATYGENFSVNPTASSGLPVSLSASGGCSVTTLTPPLVGWDVTMTSSTVDCVLTASQGGNGNYNPATNVVRTVEAAIRNIEVTADAGQTKVYGEDDPTFSYSITDGSLAGTDTFSGALDRDAGRERRPLRHRRRQPERRQQLQP